MAARSRNEDLAILEDLEDRADEEAVRLARAETETVPYEEVRRKARLV